MNKQDEPERRFVVVEKKSVMRELPEPERSYGMFGPNMGAVGFLSDVLRRMERRRAAKKRAKDS